MSFLKRLFGLGSADAPAAPPPADAVEYKGFQIRPAPFKDSGQFQTCALINKVVDGVEKEHRLIRADRFASIDDARDVSLRKARQMIDEQGDRLFG